MSGFDTATTIGLLVMAMAASLAGVSPLALLALPLAFTAAMTLCDTTDPVTTWLGGIDLGETGLLLVACPLAAWGVAAVRGRPKASRPGS